MCACLSASPYQKEGWILKTFKHELKYLFLNQMRINESANLNKYIICWPSLLDEAVYPDLIYLAIHSSAVKWDKLSPFTLFTILSPLLLAPPWLRVCQHFHYKSLFSAAAKIHSQLLCGWQTLTREHSLWKDGCNCILLFTISVAGNWEKCECPHIHEACSHLVKRSGTLPCIFYSASSLIDLPQIDISKMFSFHLHSFWNAKASTFPSTHLHHQHVFLQKAMRGWDNRRQMHCRINGWTCPGGRRTDPVILSFSINTYNPDAQIQCSCTQRESEMRGGISMIKVLFKEVIKKHSYYLSVSFLLQLHRACNSTKLPMDKNLLCDPSWHISRLVECGPITHSRKHAGRKSEGTGVWHESHLSLPSWDPSGPGSESPGPLGWENAEQETQRLLRNMAGWLHVSSLLCLEMPLN